MQISAAGLAEIERSEGWSSGPYWDSIGGVWTAYFGETQGIGPHSPRITRAEGERRLRRRFQADYAHALQPFVGKPGFTQHMYDGLASFIWNCGVGAVGAATKVGRALRDGRWRAAADGLLAWCKAGGRTIAGLLSRRKRERSLFLKPDAKPDDAYLTDWERRTVGALRAERRVARRHGGWRKVDDGHLARAVAAKANLRRRLRYLRDQPAGDKHRAERIRAIAAAVTG